jgi:hypothetical protein
MQEVSRPANPVVVVSFISDHISSECSVIDNQVALIVFWYVSDCILGRDDNQALHCCRCFDGMS